MTTMDSMKVVKFKASKLPFSLPVIVICAMTLAGLLFTEDLRALASTSIFKGGTCTKHAAAAASSSSSSHITSSANVSKVEEELMDSSLEEDVDEDQENSPIPSKQLLPFDQEKCSVADGNWVFNRSIEPLYTDSSCPYLDLQVSCVFNGRPDDDYLHWQWEMDGCFLPRFDGGAVLEKLRGKRLMFVGDSLQRAQWQSFVCLVESHLAPDQKSMKRGKSLSVFKAKEYNTTIEFYWAPFLVESNSDVPIILDLRKRVVKVDSVWKHAQNWMDVDVLVFGTYVWWSNGFKMKATWSGITNEEGYEEMNAHDAYRHGLNTWAKWIDSNINPNKTRVFFTTMSPTHTRSADWQREDGIRCYNETWPVMQRGYTGCGTDKRMMRVVKEVIGKMKVHVSILDITQLSEYRKDAHASVYTESGGKTLTNEQKSDPKRYADCIHWCLPGVPDTWNQLFSTFL